MKNNKTLINVMKIGGYLGGAVLIAALGLSGCGASKYSSAYVSETMAADTASGGYNSYGLSGSAKYDRAASEDSAEYEMAEEAGYDNGSINAGGVTADGEPAISENDAAAAEQKTSARKLIRNADISMQTEQFDKLTEEIEKKVNELGGYIESSGVYNSGYRSTDSRDANYTIRIPSDMLDEFLNTALTEGRITNKNISTEDITLRYSDLESRVKSLRIEQDRLMELISEAKDVDAIIALETRLSEIRYELESIESSLRVYDNQVTFSTVYLYINEVKAVSAAAEASFTERIAAGFKNNLISLGDFLEDTAVFIIINIPAILLFIVFAAAVICIMRAIHKKLFKTDKNAGKPEKKGIFKKSVKAVAEKEETVSDAAEQTERKEE